MKESKKVRAKLMKKEINTNKLKKLLCLPYNQIFKASMLTLLCKFLHDGFS